MPEYQETTAQATTSKRFAVAHFYLSRSDPNARSVAFEEQIATTINGVTTVAPAGQLTAPIAEADTFPVLNPSTNVPTGATATHLQLYQLIQSLYMDLAAKRDAAPPSPGP